MVIGQLWPTTEGHGDELQQFQSDRPFPLVIRERIQRLAKPEKLATRTRAATPATLHVLATKFANTQLPSLTTGEEPPILGIDLVRWRGSA